MPQNKSYAKILNYKGFDMQAIQQYKETSQHQFYLYSIIPNLKLQPQLSQIDSILNRLQIREQDLFDQLVYAVKNNLPSRIIYVKELQQVRTLTRKIHNIKHQMKNLHISVVAAKKHVWRQNS
jgi:division protein CdvB (Snf7/Vps24/ESCRT-III family)